LTLQVRETALARGPDATVSALNSEGTTTGWCTEPSGHFHGWMRTHDGVITTFEAPVIPAF